jgi:hypothetical protein
MIWYGLLIFIIPIAFCIIIGTTTKTSIWLVIAGILLIALGISAMATGIDIPNGNTITMAGGILGGLI